MEFEILIIILFAIATVVAIAARWAKMPYTVALVVAGLVLGALHAFEPPHLTKELLYALFLPGLLFEAAFHMKFKKFWQNKFTIVGLAMPGVAASMAITAALFAPATGFLHLEEGFTFIHALVFGAVIVSTDPIAVVGLFKSLGVPKRLAVLVEGESLINDGAAVVLFSLIVIAVPTGQFDFAAGITDFVKVVGMGLVIGFAVGYLVSLVVIKVEDPMIEITLTTIAAYGSFAAAEHFHFSGVIATVTAGMLCGNYAARTGMGPTTRIAVESFWEYIAFALNSLVFLLIGFEVEVAALIASWKAILVAYIAVMLGRFVVVNFVTAILRPTKERVPLRWSMVLTWGGLRGGLSMVLVLGLAADFPHRDFLITTTFGVVILSILVQGLTMSSLLKWLGLVGVQEDRQTYEKKKGVLRAANAALKELDQMARERILPPDLLEGLRAEYEQKVKNTEEEIKNLHMEKSQLREEELYQARRRLILVEKTQILDDTRTGIIGPEVSEELLLETNSRLYHLEEDEEDPSPETLSDEEAPAAEEQGQASEEKEKKETAAE